MRLSPDQHDLLATRIRQAQRDHRVHLGLDARAGRRVRLVTRRLSTELTRSRWQCLLEILVTGIEKQIKEVGLREPEKYIAFLGTLFLFVAAGSSAP